MSYNRGSQSVYLLKVHLVFVVKYRRRVLNAEMIDDLVVIFSDVCASNESVLEVCNGESDHIHLLIDVGTNTSLSRLVSILKGKSSYILRRKHKTLKSLIWKGLWADSYFAATCGGVTIDVIKRYIENQ